MQGDNKKTDVKSGGSFDKGKLLEDLKKYRKPMERMFWIFLVLILLYDALSTTLISQYMFMGIYGLLDGIGMEPDLQDMLIDSVFGIRYLIVIPAIYTIVVDVKERKTKGLLVAMLLLGWFYALYWRKQGDMVIFEILLMAVASYGKSFKKIGRISIAIASGVLLLAFALCMMGILPDSLMMRGDLVRHAFGTFHCTDLAAHWAFIILTFIFIEDGEIKWPFYLFMLVLTVLNFLFVDGRTAYLCVFMAAGGCIWKLILKKKSLKIPEKVIKSFQWVMLISFIFFATVYMILNFTYSSDPDAIYNKGLLDHLGTRLATSSNVTRVLPFSWFGSYFIQIGDGMGAAQATGIYTFLDDSYIRVYVMYGIVGFLLILTILTVIQGRLMKKGQTFRMFIMAIVAFSCFFEHHMLELSFNIFLLLLFAKLTEGEEGGEAVKQIEAKKEPA